MLAFDHRRSIGALFGITGEPNAADAARIALAKRLIYDGLLRGARSACASATPALLVDEQFGAGVLERARERGVVTAIACERSGQAEFQFEYGEAFGEHVERFDPSYVKALVRFNPDGDAELNRRQLERLRELREWLARRGPELLFELLVPPEAGQLRELGGDRDRFDAELRPELVEPRGDLDPGRPGSSPRCGRSRGSRRVRTASGSPPPAAGKDATAVSCLILGRGADAVQGRALAAGRRPGRGLRGLRRRADDLVGSDRGATRGRARPRGRGGDDRRPLSALRRRLPQSCRLRR